MKAKMIYRDIKIPGLGFDVRFIREGDYYVARTTDEELDKIEDDLKQKPLNDQEIQEIISQQDWFSMTWVDMVRRIEKRILEK